MDETIGVKGGRNDRKRALIITKKQKEKLKKDKEEKEIKELEKEVKRKQKYTLIKTIPTVLVGETFKEITKPNEKEEIIEQEPKKVSVVLKDNAKKEKEVSIKIDIKEEKLKKNIENKEVLIDTTKKEEKNEINKEETIKETKRKPKKEIKESPAKEEKQEFIPIKEEKIIASKEFEDLTEKQKNKLQKLQARKIIDVYEKQLKDIRYELRNLIIDYNTLVDEEDKITKSKEEEKILDKLNEIIEKIEELKEKIRIEDLDKYDDNYIYTLIEGYLEEFKDKKIIKEIKDSELYILISEKLDEFDKKKETFKNKVEDKKEDLEDKEETLEELREKYYKIEKINEDINKFHNEQELILKDMQNKIDNATTITERVQVQVEHMNNQSRMLLRSAALIMLMPGRRGARAFAAITAIYAAIASAMLNPETTTRRYREIKVEDYSADIKNSINKVDEVSKDLSKSSKDIDKLISDIEEEFSDYIGVIKECDELLSNLKKVKSNLKEKEYELEKIKSKQEKELVRNNAKVKTIGNYPM
jgi:hypothetical protein